MPDTQKTFLALVKAPAVRNVEINLESSDILDAIYDDDDYDEDRYDSDPDYAAGVDDAMDELDW